MSEIFMIGNEQIRKEELENTVDKVLEVLKKEKRTYRVNKSILKFCLEKLEKQTDAIIFH